MSRWPLALAPLLVLLPACTGGSGSEPVAAITDSAGIQIVTSQPPARIDTLGPTPRWSIRGSADAEDGALFDVTDLVTTLDGGVIVANHGNSSVVAFDAEGQERWRFGRRGEGPGEFQGELSLAAVGDTIFAFDFNSRRLTLIGSDGTLAGTLQLELPDPNLELLGGRSNGDLLFTSRNLLGPNEGINRDSVVYLAVRTDGTRLGVVGWGRYRNVDFVMGQYGPNIHDEAFGPSGSVAIVGDVVVQTDGRTAEVMRRDASGVVTQLLRWEEAAAPITDADRAALAESRRASTADEFQKIQLEEWLTKATWPATKPLTELVVGRPDGGVLVASFCTAGSAGCRWYEFDREGRWLRTLWLPMHAQSAVSSGELLITLAVDDVGLERLDAWGLR